MVEAKGRLRREAALRGGDAGAGRQNLLAEPRRMKILAWLQEEGSARVRELSAAFDVSEATIRQAGRLRHCASTSRNSRTTN